MKITVLTSNLQKNLSFLNHGISPKNQLPILLNLLLETEKDTLKISSTDLEIGIEVKIPATINETGGITVPAKTFTELINSLNEETVVLQAVGGILEVSSKKTKSKFQTIGKEDFPNLYEEKGEKIVTLHEKDVKEDFASVVFAASQDTTRPALSGVLVRREDEGFLLVATDGYRLSLKHYKVQGSMKESKSFIVPARVFREVAMIKEEKSEIDMFVSAGSNQILFEQGGTVVVGRLIEADFPPFEKIIPSDFSVNTTFDREEMQKAVKICSIFARDAANIVKLSLRKDHVLVSSQSPTVGENTVRVDAVLNGEENEIAFNARYLLDLFANTDVKEMVFEMTGPLNPGVFKIKEDNSFLHLIMPIRVQA